MGEGQLCRGAVDHYLADLVLGELHAHAHPRAAELAEVPDGFPPDLPPDLSLASALARSSSEHAARARDCSRRCPDGGCCINPRRGRESVSKGGCEIARRIRRSGTVQHHVAEPGRASTHLRSRGPAFPQRLCATATARSRSPGAARPRYSFRREAVATRIRRDSEDAG